MGFKSSSAPPPPDYAGAARATAEGNLDAARANIAANRVNQYTPYGSLEYQQSVKTLMAILCGVLHNPLPLHSNNF